MGAKITRKAGDAADILKRLVASTKLPHVNVGFLEGKTYPDGTPVAQVAYWNEFGTKSMPPRPFMRQAIAANKTEWAAKLGGALTHTGGDVKAALTIMGQVMEGDVKEKITDGVFEPNTETTNLLKSRFPTGNYTMDDFLQAAADAKAGETAQPGKPLVWSGLMLQSVTSEVKDA